MLTGILRKLASIQFFKSMKTCLEFNQFNLQCIGSSFNLFKNGNVPIPFQYLKKMFHYYQEFSSTLTIFVSLLTIFVSRGVIPGW